MLIAIAAVAGYVNRRVLKLPVTSGTLVVALISSLVVVATDTAFPRLDLQTSIGRRPRRNRLQSDRDAVVVFSILVQGLTLRRVLVHYGVGEPDRPRRLPGRAHS